MNIDEKIDQIRFDLNTLSQKEYLKNKYTPAKTSAKDLKNTVKEKEAEIEINKMKGKINKMIQQKEQKKNVYIDKSKAEIGNNAFMDNTSDTFNIVDDEKDYTDWRKLPVPDKLEILEDFFDTDNMKHGVPYSEEIKEELRDLVNDNKILYKKDILYDKINAKILDIPLVKYQNGTFVLKGDEKKVNIKKKNLSNINKLLKIK